MDEDRHWRRFDEDEDFKKRSGALDRRWGYGDRLAPGYRRREIRPDLAGSEFEYEDEYNAPRYWLYQIDWMRPGPFTGMGPRGYRRSDERILDDVCQRLTQHGGIDARNIDVNVEDGEVTIAGEVENRRIKRMVEANVEMIQGVIDVHNRLRLSNREEKQREERGEEVMENPFPGGPEPSGPAGY